MTSREKLVKITTIISVTLFVISIALSLCTLHKVKRHERLLKMCLDIYKNDDEFIEDRLDCPIIRDEKKKIEPQSKKEKPGKKDPKPTNELDLFARLIFCEMGSTWHPDEQLYNVGSVVLNRVNDPRFPSTITGVIYQKGQYAPAIDGSINYVQADDRCYRIASELLKNGSVIDPGIVWQAEFKQGNEVAFTYTDNRGTTTYYCK